MRVDDDVLEELDKLVPVETIGVEKRERGRSAKARLALLVGLRTLARDKDVALDEAPAQRAALGLGLVCPKCSEPFSACKCAPAAISGVRCGGCGQWLAACACAAGECPRSDP